MPIPAGEAVYVSLYQTTTSTEAGITDTNSTTTENLGSLEATDSSTTSVSCDTADGVTFNEANALGRTGATDLIKDIYESGGYKWVGPGSFSFIFNMPIAHPDVKAHCFLATDYSGQTEIDVDIGPSGSRTEIITDWDSSGNTTGAVASDSIFRSPDVNNNIELAFSRDGGSSTYIYLSGVGIEREAGAGPSVVPPRLHGLDNQFMPITAARLGGLLS